MQNNDILRSLRYLLEINNNKIVEICALAGLKISKDEVPPYLLKEDEVGYVRCSDSILSHFLNGLVIYKRGKDENREPAPVELPMSNNVVLKKLKVAFQLKDDDIIEIVNSSGLNFGKSELSAFLRKKDHRNYRECGDQVLRNFLKGLVLRLQQQKKEW
jgi:uncharacterized protein YehS (DUF1456 family)